MTRVHLLTRIAGAPCARGRHAGRILDHLVRGARAGLVMLGEDPRFDATALQTLDRKGWDGIAAAIVVDATGERLS